MLEKNLKRKAEEFHKAKMEESRKATQDDKGSEADDEGSEVDDEESEVDDEESEVDDEETEMDDDWDRGSRETVRRGDRVGATFLLPPKESRQA
jgi:hypothetical protein